MFRRDKIDPPGSRLFADGLQKRGRVVFRVIAAGDIRFKMGAQGVSFCVRQRWLRPLDFRGFAHNWRFIFAE